MSYNPWRGEPTPCWHCSGYDGMTAGATAALCARPHSSRVRGQPQWGCSAWQREVGADDDPEWSPMATERAEATIARRFQAVPWAP